MPNFFNILCTCWRESGPPFCERKIQGDSQPRHVARSFSQALRSFNSDTSRGCVVLRPFFNLFTCTTLSVRLISENFKWQSSLTLKPWMKHIWIKHSSRLGKFPLREASSNRSISSCVKYFLFFKRMTPGNMPRVKNRYHQIRLLLWDPFSQAKGMRARKFTFRFFKLNLL